MFVYGFRAGTKTIAYDTSVKIVRFRGIVFGTYFYRAFGNCSYDVSARVKDTNVDQGAFNMSNRLAVFFNCLVFLRLHPKGYKFRLFLRAILVKGGNYANIARYVKCGATIRKSSPNIF